MLKQLIKVLVQSTVAGPKGHKLRAGKVYELEDSPYIRILVRSGTVSLIDPPSLDPEYLERAGYELREGHSYPEKPVPEASAPEEPEAPEAPIKEEPFVGMSAEKTTITAPHALTVSSKKGTPKGTESPT